MPRTTLQGWWHQEGGGRELMRLAFPLIVSSSFWTLQITIDRILLSRYSPDAVAASMPAALYFWTPLLLFQNTAGYAGTFVASPKHTLIDDHLELQKVGIRAIDVVDFDYPSWHTIDDTIDKVSGASLQIVGDVAVELVRREAESR